jgi:hypothetical protein
MAGHLIITIIGVLVATIGIYSVFFEKNKRSLNEN